MKQQSNKYVKELLQIMAETRQTIQKNHEFRLCKNAKNNMLITMCSACVFTVVVYLCLRANT